MHVKLFRKTFLRQLLSFFVLIFVSQNVNAQTQDKFVLKGVILFEKKPLIGAKVGVFEGAKQVFVVQTKKKGKYLLRLPLHKDYTIKFSKDGLSTKTIKLSTVFPDDFDRRKLRANIFVTLKTEAEKEDVVASYRYNPNGQGVLDYDLVYSAETEAALAKVDKSRLKREEYESEVEGKISRLDATTRLLAYQRYDSIKHIIDSLVGYASKEAQEIVLAAKKQRGEILSDVEEQSQTFKQLDNFLAGKLPTAEEIEKFYVDREAFLVRKDIRKRELQNMELAALRQKSRDDSLQLMENAIFIRDELLKTARYQLEIDRLNAQTAQDSLVLVEKEQAISKAEQEIDLARTRLDLQLAEIENKNIILVSVGIGLMLLIGLLLLYINKSRERKRMNKELAIRSNEITRQNNNIVASINYARNIQHTILPANFSSSLVSDYFILFRPKDIVSGDFFWFHKKNSASKRLYVAAVDCTGHGVPGAFMSLIGNRLLNEIVREDDVKLPSDILTELNSRLVEALNQKHTENRDGMDIALCVIEELDDKHRKVTYSGAKRPLLYIEAETGEVKTVKGDRISIGGFREDLEKVFTQKELILPNNSLLYLSSDGFIDQNNEDRKRFGSSRLFTLLKNSTTLSMAEQLDYLESELESFQGNSEQRDDITIVGLRL